MPYEDNLDAPHLRWVLSISCKDELMSPTEIGPTGRLGIARNFGRTYDYVNRMATGSQPIILPCR